MSYERQFVRLRIYNIFMGFLHLVQATAVFILSNEFTLPITASFVEYTSETGKLGPVSIATSMTVSFYSGGPR